MEKKEVEKYNNQIITVSNPMIRSKKETNLLESKIEALAMYYMSRDMKQKMKKDSRGKDYSVNYVLIPAKEIVTLMSREYGEKNKTGGKTYDDIRGAALSMKQKVFIIEDRENERFVMKSMYGDVAYDEGLLYVEFEPSMEKHFLGLKQNFSKLKLPILFSFKRNGGFQLYKLLKSYAYPPNLEEIDMDLSQEELPTYSVSWNLTDLRMELGCINLSDPRIKTEASKKRPDWDKMEKIADEDHKVLYGRWIDLYNRVIKPGIEEINKLSDIYISDFIKETSGHGGKVTGVTFVIQHNKAYYEKRSGKKTENKLVLTDEQKDDFIESLFDIIEERLSPKDFKMIAEAGNYDFDKIKSVYELSKTSGKINNLVGWLIKGLKEGYSKPVSAKNEKKTEFNDFMQRKYDYAELEREALA